MANQDNRGGATGTKDEKQGNQPKPMQDAGRNPNERREPEKSDQDRNKRQGDQADGSR